MIAVAALLALAGHAQTFPDTLSRGSASGPSLGRGADAGLLAAGEALDRRAESLGRAMARAARQASMSIDSKDPLAVACANLGRAATAAYTAWSFHRDVARCREDFREAARAGIALHQILPKHPLRPALQREWDAAREAIDEFGALLRFRKIDWDRLPAAGS